MSENPLVEGMEPVIAFYGYWPTFHDAVIRRVEFDGVTLPGKDSDNEANVLKISFVLNDSVDDAGNCRFSPLTVQWQEVEQFSLAADYAGSNQNWLWQVNFRRNGEWLDTELVLCDGINGTIRARRVEVIDFRPIEE